MPRAAGVGVACTAIVLLAMLAAPVIVPHDPDRQFADLSYAPPMRPHVIDGAGRFHAPFIYPIRLVDRLEHRFVEDRSVRVPLAWFDAGALVRTDDARAVWLPLGGDALGRDMFARVVTGGRLSLGVGVAAALAALLLGTLIGAIAGFHGGWMDEALMRLADVVLVLPVVYVVIVLRGTMPLVLSTWHVFWTLAVIMSLAGWPYAARGVRAVVSAERSKEYAEAARALGAGSGRILLRHLLPATRSFLIAQLTLLVPAFVLAEATLSFVGFGFAEPTASWGVMLHEAAQAGLLYDAPWLLAPAAAIALSVLGLQLLSDAFQARGRDS